MTTEPMDPKLLRGFLVLAEELHIGNAAARLHLTQPPLSKQIRQLEELLQVRLFERNRRGVRLTAAGAALVTEAQRLIAQSNLAVESVRQVARGDSGHVRIAFNASVLFMDVEHIVTRVENALPGLRSTWEEMGSSEQTDAPRQDRIDMGFAQAPQTLQGLESRVVAKVPMAIALPARHPLAKRRSVPLGALRDEDFVLVPREIGPGFFDLVIAACVSAGFSPRLRHQARHLLTTLSLVATSGAVSLVPETLARASLPGVALRRIAGGKVEASYSVMWNPANTLPVLPKVLVVFGAR
jgi:DNA-binding transcriptional LysR family regulator